MNRSLHRGEVYLLGVEFYLSKYKETNNIDFLELSCFNIYQTIELFIRGALKILGNEYNSECSLSDNVNVFENIVIENNVKNYEDIVCRKESLVKGFRILLKDEDKLYYWRDNSRYDDNFTVNKE